MSREYQTMAWIVLGIVIVLYMITSCTYSVNVVQTRGVSTDAIDEHDHQQLTLPA